MDFFKKLKQPFTRNPFKKDGIPARLPEEATPGQKGLFDLDRLKEELTRKLKAGERSALMRALVASMGIGIVAGGLAADVMFLGGIGTATVAAALYADFRNARMIRDVSREIARLEGKLDQLRADPKESMHLAPALEKLHGTVAAFEAAAYRNKTPEAAALGDLREQVERLQKSLSQPAPEGGDSAGLRKNKGP